MSPLILLLGAVAGLWVYRDAQNYGYSKNAALLWAIGCFAFVFVFFPIYLLLGRKPQMKSNRRVEEKTIEAEATIHQVTIDCPMCARKVEEDFKVCPYCGYSLKFACENCGKELERDWKTCPYCQSQAPEK